MEKTQKNLETKALFIFSNLKENITYNFSIKEAMPLLTLIPLSLIIKSNDNEFLSFIPFNNNVPPIR